MLLRIAIMALGLLLVGMPLPAQKSRKANKAKKSQMFMQVVPQLMGQHWKIQVIFEAEAIMGLDKAQGFEASYALYTAQDSLIEEKQVNLEKEAKRYEEGMCFNIELHPNRVPKKLLVTLRRTPLPNEKPLEAFKAIWLPPVQETSSWYNETEKITWVRLGDTLRVIGTNTVLYRYHFPQEFYPADPPMQLQSTYPSPYMDPKSVTRVLARQPFTPTEKGLYYIQEDTSTNVGTSIMVTEADYPKLKKLEHLADAMIYISTLEEIAKVKNTDDLKKSLDEFWLKLGGTEVNAQRLVKMYYQRVAHVNRYFSSFKEGWKTDRGMIYIVFGRPSEVIQDGQTEQWVYHDLASGQGRFAFEFDRKPSLFSHNHYVLRRGQALALPWYAQVQQWRKGTVL